jgi:hypothetical protein
MTRADLFLYRWLAIFATMLVLLFPVLIGFAWFGYGFTESRLFYYMGATAVLGLLGAIAAAFGVYANWDSYKYSERGGLGLALFGFYVLLFCLAFLLILGVGSWYFHDKTLNTLPSLIENRQTWDERYNGYSLGHAHNDVDVYFKASGFLCGVLALIIMLAMPYYMKLANRL